MMQIDRSLNIVIEVESARLGTIFVHSTPISREVFERYFLVLSKVYSAFDRERIWSSAPRVASLLLRTTAEATERVSMSLGSPRNEWEGPDGVENGLLNEMRRLTNVCLPGAQGWTTMPFVDAVRGGQIDADDVGDIESLLVFFTCLSASPQSRRGRAEMTERMASGLGVRTVSSNSSEFAASLPTSIETGNSGATPPTS